MKKIVVLYHQDCWDGFGAAWAAWKKFGGKASYISVQHQIPPPKGLIDREIYLLDFCYEWDVMKNLIGKNRKVIVIDHHISKKNIIRKIPGSIYGDKNSGSVLSWKYFHSHKNIPKILKYIEANDMWKFNLPKSSEIYLAMDTLPFDFKILNNLARDFRNKKGIEKYITKGEIIRDYITAITNEVLQSAEEVVFKGRKVLAINTSRFLRSYVGNAIVRKGYPFGITWYKKGNEIHVSLRSGNKVDVTKIAEEYGGGGHKKAAGFTIFAGDKLEKHLPWKRVKKNSIS